MPARKKPFDAVELKNRLQARLRAQRRRLGEAEAMRRQQEWLATSDDPLAKWWRSIRGSAKTRCA